MVRSADMTGPRARWCTGELTQRLFDRLRVENADAADREAWNAPRKGLLLQPLHGDAKTPRHGSDRQHSRVVDLHTKKSTPGMAVGAVICR